MSEKVMTSEGNCNINSEDTAENVYENRTFEHENIRDSVLTGSKDMELKSYNPKNFSKTDEPVLLHYITKESQNNNINTASETPLTLSVQSFFKANKKNKHSVILNTSPTLQKSGPEQKGSTTDSNAKKKSDTAPIVENEEQNDGLPVAETVQPERDTSGISRVSSYITVATLLVINLLNYMDRFTVAGVLKDVQSFYQIENSEAGLIQTSFICTYMIFSPIFGYLGDRYTRKYIMAVGIFFWSLFTLSSSFVPRDNFWGFVILRAMVGIGEASYSTIAPTIIADLFTKEMRTKMLMIFYFAIPVGSGLGYIVGSYVAKALGGWEWALRVTPGLGVLCVILILIFCKEPPRGHAEGGTHLVSTSYIQDIKALLKNPSFMFSTVGFTAVAFVTGALAFWAPTYMQDSIEAQGKIIGGDSVAFLFGIITVAAGFLGVGLGAETARRYKRVNPRADPIICAIGLLTCVPFLFLALVFARYNTAATWVLIFLGETVLCMNWAVVTDILLYVVIPTRRSTAEAFQILISHTFGDAGSPYLVGLISDSLTSHFPGSPTSPAVQFVTLQYALYSTSFVCVLGGGFFLACALFVEKDRNKAERQIKGKDIHSPSMIDASIIGEDSSMDVPAVTPMRPVV